jgi:hypothetical protein
MRIVEPDTELVFFASGPAGAPHHNVTIMPKPLLT